MDDDPQDQPQEVLKHPDFWLRDGSIILAVQHVLFKVHQTILAQHSEIFADLFDLPQPELDIGDDEQLEGCRVVELQDSPNDFEDLLRAIYRLDHFDTLSPAASLDDVLIFITGILRLSTKYMIRGLRAKCIKILIGRFPVTYDEYLARSPLARPYSPPARSGVDSNAINNLIELTQSALHNLSDNSGTVNASATHGHRDRNNRPRRSHVALNPSNPPPSFPTTSVYTYAWPPPVPGGTNNNPVPAAPGSAPATTNAQWTQGSIYLTGAPPAPPPSAPATQSTNTTPAGTPPTHGQGHGQAASAPSQPPMHPTHGPAVPSAYQPPLQPRHSSTHRHRAKHKTDTRRIETAADAPKPTASAVMRAIAVAYEGRVYTILPYAYYLLARTSAPRRFLHKGQQGFFSAASASQPNLPGPNPNSSALHPGIGALPTISWQEKTICLVGRALLRSAELSMSHSFLVAFQPSVSCRQPARCSNSRGPLLEWALLEAAGKGPEPLKGWDRWEKLGVCADCVSECMRKHEAGRREVWERLPEFFDLEGWDKLKDLQET